ncbi:MAG: O-antigen ligase family protein [Hyphomicrobiaceae bacterium]
MHNDTPLASVALRPQWASYVPAMALIAVVVAAISPRATPFMLLLLGGSIAALGFASAALSWRPLPGLVVALLVLDAYLGLNALWSLSPAFALGRVVIVALIAAMGLAVARALPALTPADATRLQSAILCAIVATSVYLAIEVVFDQPLRRLVVSIIPPLRPAPKHMTTVDGWVTGINLYTLNRNLAVLNIMLWPALLLLRTRFSPSKAWLSGGALIALGAIAAFPSEHETSMIALVVGCIVLAGMAISASVTRALVIALWIAATMLVVPAANIAHDAGLHRVAWLPQTARNRIVLWNVTADRMLDSPILGIGIGSTKPLDEEAAHDAPLEEGDAYAQRTGRHAHNIFMQAWFELGAAGAILLLVVGLIALRAMIRLPAKVQPFTFASFASTMVVASFSWGMWQPWFMCAFGFWAVLLLIGLDAARRAAPST